MATSVKKSSRRKTPSKSLIVSKNVKDYSKDPFFVEKSKAMEAVLKKHGVPNSQNRA